MPLRIIGDSYYSYNNQLAADNEQSLSEQFTLDYLDDPRVAATIAANQNRYNHLTPGIALALGKAGQGPDSPLTQAASQAAAQRKSEKGIWGGLGSVLGVALPALGKIIHTALYPLTTPTARAAIRYPFAVLQAGTEGIDNAAANAARLLHDDGIFKGAAEAALGLGSGALWHPEKTTLGQHITQGKSIGTGYFASGPAHQAADDYRRTVYEIDGHAPTLGRIVDKTINEPGYLPHSLVSGAVDWVKATKLDPGYNALKAYSNFRKASTVLSEVSRADSAERLAAGLIDHTPRVTVDDNRVMSWMHNVEEGQKFVKAATDLDSPYKIMRTFKGIDTETARLLSETRTDPETMAVISDRYLTGRLSDIPSKRLPLTISDNPAAQLRIWQSIPRDNIAHYNDLDQTAHLLEAHLLNARMSPDAIEYHFNRLLYTANPEEWHTVLNNAMEDAALRVAGQVDHTGTVTSTGKALGIGQKVYLNDRDVLGEVVNLKSEEKIGRTLDRAIGAVDEVPYTEHQAVVRVPGPHGDELLTVPVDTLSTHTPVSWVRSMFRHARQVAAEEAGHAVDEVADGTPRGTILTGDGVVDIGTAHPTAEALSSTYIFPNIREVRRLSSAYGRLLATTPLGVIPDIGDGFNKVWRPLKLFSIASGIRALSEDQMRVAASGGQSFFSHPIRTLQVVIG